MPDAPENETPTLVDSLLKDACATARPLSIYLVNGFQLKGEVVSFDSESVLFRHKDTHQIIMRSAIAGLYPLPQGKRGADQWWKDYLPPGQPEG